MSSISKHVHIFSIIFFAINLNCFSNNSESESQIAAEENPTCQKPQQPDIDSKNEMMHIWQKKRSKDERKKLKEELTQAKKEKKEAKPSQFIYYISETLPFACLIIAPYIAPTIASIPLLNQAFNKLSQTSINAQNSNNNNKIDLTSHALCLTIARLLARYVEKQELAEEFQKGKIKKLEDNLQEKKKEKKAENKPT